MDHIRLRHPGGAKEIRPATGLREHAVMIGRRQALKVGLTAILAYALPVGRLTLEAVAQASTGDAEAKAFIESLADRAIAALTAPDISRNERETRARGLLTDNFAVPTIAQFVLGRYWRVATDEERSEYLKLFEQLIVDTYIDRFSRYSGETLKVTRTAADAESGDVMVYSEISRPAGKPIEVGWRVRSVGSAFKIVDVFVEGVSMGQTQRSEFSSVIRNNGGTVEALLEEMRRRIHQQT